MLDSFRKGQRWLTFIFVSVIGLVFVFFLGVGGGFGPTTPTGNAIIELDDVRLTERDLARAREETENRLRAELGDAYEQLGAERFLDAQAFSSLLNTVILAAAADEMGLLVTKEELRRIVQASPLFRDEGGRFSPEAFDRFASYNYGSQRAFVQTFTRDLLGQKLVQLLAGQTRVSDAEVDLRTRYELEEARIAYVALPTDRLPADRSLDESEIEAWAAEHEEDLRGTYETRREGLSEPERVRARHVLILAAADASEEEIAAARGRAAEARDRIEGGEPFEDVAAELSEDAGTARDGGDLGLFARGDNDPALDEAAFALEPGGLSDVIRSAYGFHVLRVEERLEARTPDFEEVSLELAREEAERASALAWADEKSQTLADAVEAGTSLEEAARAEGLTLERPPTMKRRSDGFIAGLGAAPELLTTAFTLDTGESSSTIFDLPGRRVLIQVLERTGPDATQLANERASRRQSLETEKQNQVIQSWLNGYRSELEKSGRLRINAELALGT